MKIVVVLILIGIAVIIFWSPLSTAIASQIKGGGGSAACTVSLFEGKGLAKCPIDDVIIYDDRVEIKKEHETEYGKLMEKGSRAKDEMAKEALAKLLGSCYDRGGGHGSRAFSRNSWFSSEGVCLECSNIVIDDSAGNINGLTDYLEKNKPKGITSKKTYMEILTKDNTHRDAYMNYDLDAELSPQSEDFTFRQGEDYTIFFIGRKAAKITNLFNKFKHAVEGDVFSLFKNSDTYFTYIIKSSELGIACKRKVN